jgi:hypothetical protein
MIDTDLYQIKERRKNIDIKEYLENYTNRKLDIVDVNNFN